MQAEIIAIGDELVSGQRLNTNSMWLSQRLGELGIAAGLHTVVGDQLEEICRSLRLACQRADVVILTGGLGPTADDLTRQAIAETAGVPLVLDQASLEHIEARFARRGRPMPAANVIQATFPEGAGIIPNPHGTAPGIDMLLKTEAETPPVRIIALPGVPAEMVEMWNATVVPILEQMQTGQRKVILHRLIKCFGVGESDLEQMLPDLIRRGRSPAVGITVSQATITLRITAEGSDAAHCRQLMEPVAQTIYACLGDLVFGEGEVELPDVVVPLLVERQLTLSTVECSTGGLLAHWLSEADLGGRVIRGGTVAPDTNALRAILPTPQSYTGSDLELVRWMAMVCRQQFATDLALAVGPLMQQPEQTPGVIIALAMEGDVLDEHLLAAGHPEIHRPRTAKHALNLLRRQIKR